MNLAPALGLALLLAPTLGATTLVTNQAATKVIGQSSLTAVEFLTPPTASSLLYPEGSAYDPVTGKIYVADSGNNRILRFASAAAATNGAAAEAVFGQPDFTTDTEPATTEANTLGACYSPAVDSAGTLWVVDKSNSRVLGFKNAATKGNQPDADIVLGQPDFKSATDATSAEGMSVPTGLAIGANNTLWVADTGNNRVLRFDNVTSITSGAAAKGVIGQVDFTSSTGNSTGDKFQAPTGLSVDAAGRLWVADTNNNRVLRFDNAANAPDGVEASGVLGQSDFTTTTFGLSATKFENQSVNYVFAAADGTVWVSDFYNNRVLGFRNAASLAKGAPAGIVLGQPNFTTADAGVNARAIFGPGMVGPGPNGTFLVCDYNSSRILVFTSAKRASLTVTTRTGTTTKPTAVISGKATGEVTSVTYKVGNKSGKATGTTSWKFTAKLKPGINVISVVATGPAGNSSTKKITITRK